MWFETSIKFMGYFMTWMYAVAEARYLQRGLKNFKNQIHNEANQKKKN